MIFAKVTGQTIKYPHIAKQADPDNGIFPVVVDKPDTFRDEDEVWLDPILTKKTDFVHVELKKRPRTAEEKQSLALEKQEMNAREASDVGRIVSIIKALHADRKLSDTQRSDIITTLKS